MQAIASSLRARRGKRGTRACFGNDKQFGLSKRSQLKIQQMSFMLIAVTILVILVLLFFLAVKAQDLRKDAQESETREAQKKVLKLTGYAELSCPGRQNCIDLDKAMALKKLKAYDDFFGAGIDIIKLGNRSIDCDEANYPDCDRISLFNKQGIGIGNFVVVCWRDSLEGYSYERCNLGKVILYVEKK